MFKKVVRFFDRLEDIIRAELSRSPILYSLVGAIGIILVWKGVWETAEMIPGLHGIPSVILGGIILALTGLFVSYFIGDSIILSGLRREKKFAEKTSKEILQAEAAQTEEILEKLEGIEQDIAELKGGREESALR